MFIYELQPLFDIFTENEGNLNFKLINLKKKEISKIDFKNHKDFLILSRKDHSLPNLILVNNNTLFGPTFETPPNGIAWSLHYWGQIPWGPGGPMGIPGRVPMGSQGWGTPGIPRVIMNFPLGRSHSRAPSRCSSLN